MKFHLFAPSTCLTLAGLSRAEMKLPAIIGDSMVPQQKQVDPVWGWDTPGTPITVSFAGQIKTAATGSDGRWTVKLDAMPANAGPQAMTIKGTSERILKDILIGEVWMCSGQSNMRFNLKDDWKGDLEAMTAICGPDRVWQWAQAKITGSETVEVWSDLVPEAVAVRYAWADNPVWNLLTKDGLPVTPFRSDDFELTTRPKPPEVKAAP